MIGEDRLSGRGVTGTVTLRRRAGPPAAADPKATTEAPRMLRQDPPPLAPLVAGLLAHADRCDPRHACSAPLREMEPVLELDVGGVRYVLMRECEPDPRGAITLSSRELEIARMIARGHTNRTIAAVLDISPWTVSTHLRRIFAKLDVSSRAAMVGVLTTHGLIGEREGRPDAL